MDGGPIREWRSFSNTGGAAGSASTAHGRGRMALVSTRTLIVLAAITGLAILAASAVQILLAR